VLVDDEYTHRHIGYRSVLGADGVWRLEPFEE